MAVEAPHQQIEQVTEARDIAQMVGGRVVLETAFVDETLVPVSVRVDVTGGATLVRLPVQE